MWLHYAGGLTQTEVARRLGVPSVKAHRMIARAVAEGVVKVTIDASIVEDEAIVRVDASPGHINLRPPVKPAK